MVSLAYPGSFGTENAIRLLELNRDEKAGMQKKDEFYIECGKETFDKWQHNFDYLIRKYQELMKGVQFKAVVRQGITDLADQDALKDIP